MTDDTNRYLGKYRGFVENNFDPENRGRIQVTVPDVQGDKPLASYALPCLPAAAMGSGTFVVPDNKSQVWVEFENGDPEYPIWTGCFWGNALELPETGRSSIAPNHNIVLQTFGKNSITVSGIVGGGVLIASGPVLDPASPTVPHIMVNSTGITISTGPGLAEIRLNGPSIQINGTPVDINVGALTILKKTP